MSGPPTSPAAVNGPLVAIVDDGRDFVSLHRIPPLPQIDGQTMNVITLEGLPLTYHDPRWHPEVLKHLLIVQGPSLVKNKELRSLGVCRHRCRQRPTPKHGHYDGKPPSILATRLQAMSRQVGPPIQRSCQRYLRNDHRQESRC
jgi:hypothetical protein